MNPWQRYGWMLGAIWLVFLMHPITALINTQHCWAVKLLGFGLIGLFALIYVWLFRGHSEGASSWHTNPGTGFIALWLIAAVMIAFIGADALSLTPFLVAYGCWVINLRVGIITSVICLVLALTVSALTSNWLWTQLTLIIGLILVTATIMNMITKQGIATEELRRENAIIAERDRMARDVHDLLGHSLTVVGLKTQLAIRLIETDPQRAREELRAISELTSEALAGVRATVTSEHGLTFADSVDTAVKTLQDAGLNVQQRGTAPALSSELDTSLALVMREVTTNILRHAHAEQVVIILNPNSLSVSDNGNGLLDAREGNGITGMRRRLGPHGARLHLRPAPGGGTEVAVTW